MTTPPPIPESALRRLRRSYVLLLLLLSVPIAAAMVYLLALQYQLVWNGTQRQMAMSTDRRVTRLDGVLAPLRDDVLRIRNSARDTGLPRDVVADRGSLTPIQGGWTLDALPPLLHHHAPQVILIGEHWNDPSRREASVLRASVFAEQARLVASQGGSFRRVYFVDAAAGELWLHPWVGSSQLLGEAQVASAGELVRELAERARLRRGGSTLDDEVHWQTSTDGESRRWIELTTLVPAAGQQRFVVGEVPAGALDAVQIEAGIGRFWVLDRDGAVVLDHVAREHPRTGLTSGAPPQFDRDRVGDALHSPLAIEAGPLLLAARPSAVAPWTALYAGESAFVRQRVLGDIGPYIVAGAALLTLFTLVAILLWRRLGQPSLRLVDYLHRKARDPLAEPPDVPSAWTPWVQLTHHTYSAWREAAAREQRSEALKSSIVDHALAAVVATDERGLIVEFNPAAEAMFGRRREQVLGRPVAEVAIPHHFPLARDSRLQRLAAGDVARMLGQRMEMSALRADGTEFPVEIVLWRADVGSDAFYTASLVDLTERKRAAGELERHREALRQSEKLTAMGSLLAGVAHELNNPLSIVMGRASLLEAKTDDSVLRDDIVRIREAAERCGRIVRTFLGMARKTAAAPRPVQINDLVRGGVDLLQYNLRSGGVTVDMHLAEPLPTVCGDADRLGQLVLNLIVNAQQALDTQNPPRCLRIETGVEVPRPSRAPRVWLRVADNGPGIDASMASRVFDPFFTTKPEGVGTGLGLAVSRSVAREHGGDLVLESSSAYGRGASFRLSLPIASDAGEGAAASPQDAADSEAAAARVLVVDDEPEVAELMREMLESAHFEVAIAESGAVALELLSEARFDAVVSDLRMPDMDGPALWRALAERFPQLVSRVVFVTGDTLSPGAREFLRETRRPCVEKPFTPQDLVRAVQSALPPT